MLDYMTTKREVKDFLKAINRDEYKVVEKMFGYLVERPDGRNVFIHAIDKNYQNLIYNLVAAKPYDSDNEEI